MTDERHEENIRTVAGMAGEELAKRYYQVDKEMAASNSTDEARLAVRILHVKSLTSYGFPPEHIAYYLRREREEIERIIAALKKTGQLT